MESSTLKQDQPEFMTNSKGHLVPVGMVKEAEKLEDDIVNELYRKANKISNDLKDFKGRAFLDVSTFMDLVAEKYGVQIGGRKGNLTLTSYDGKFKVCVAIADYIDFGPQLDIAKSLIDECIKEWSNETGGEIRVLIDHAFQVDKNKRVNTKAILGLRRLNITHEKWKMAMEAISDGIKVVSSKQYIRFYSRPSVESEWSALNLDIAGA